MSDGMTDEEFDEKLEILFDEGCAGSTCTADEVREHIDRLRADLARVTEERDRLAAVVGEYREAYGRWDADAEFILASIRAEARAEALEEAAAAAGSPDAPCFLCGDPAVRIRALAKKGADD